MKLVLNIDHSNDSGFCYCPIVEGRVLGNNKITATAGMYPFSNVDFYGFWSSYKSAEEVRKWVIDNKDLVMFLNPEGIEELCSHRFHIIEDARKAEIIRELNKHFVAYPDNGLRFFEIDGFELFADDLRMIADLIDNRPMAKGELNPEEIENLDLEFM